jgi:SAM-dependent methyltransferase
MLTWLDDERFVVGDATFHTIPDGASESEFKDAARRAGDAGEFFVAKSRWRVERYVDVMTRLRPQRIVELGIYQGGSTALFAEVARPRRLVAIDREQRGYRRLEDHLSRSGLDDVVRIYRGVDQADSGRLAEIADAAFEGQAIDLVVDDCSHQYDASRVSLNEFLPRLRPGGVYVIEDWPWAHSAVGAADPRGLYPDQVPLTRLIFELVLAIPGVRGLIREITMDTNSVYVTRGEAEIDPGGFDISECSNARGRSLLTAPQPPGMPHTATR